MKTHPITGRGLRIALLALFASNAGSGLHAQTLPEGADSKFKYRRSSLDIILIESDAFPRKETVLKAYGNIPFPDKYNNHTVVSPVFNPKNYSKDTAANVPVLINKYISENHIANQLVAKWFNRQADGSFDMSLIAERGQYDATEMQANIAKGTVRGTASLSDAGEELIKNTFVVFNRVNFVSNEPIAAAIRVAAKLEAARLGSLWQSAANMAADIVYNKTKEGYSVWTTSYLYKLKWNDSTAAVFYNDLWLDKQHPDAKRKAAFDQSGLFSLEFVGDAKSSTLVTFKFGKSRTEDQIVELATARNVENVFAKLQKTYDVFKPKTPLYTGEPITAKIGMKEGLKGGEKFEVLEQSINPKTGLTEYKRVGTVSVDKKNIWDNRYNAGEELAAEEGKAEDKKPQIDRTTFKGGSKYYPGMLLRQIK